MEEEEIPIEKWKLKFMNLPCDEQLYFAQKVALDESLNREFIKRLQEQDQQEEVN